MKTLHYTYFKYAQLLFSVLFFTALFSAHSCQANYSIALEHFENSRFSKAVSLLTAYTKSGSTIGLAYLKYMHEHSGAKAAYTPPYNCVPDVWLEESNNALQASLAYMTILNTRQNPNDRAQPKATVEEKNTALKNLTALIMKQKCPRAAVLLGKLFENNFSLIKELSFFKLFNLQKITSAQTFYPWAYKQLPPFKALSDLDLLCKAHAYVFKLGMTPQSLQKNYPTYAKHLENEDFRLTALITFCAQLNQIKHCGNKQLLDKYLCAAQHPFTAMLELQNSIRSAASLLYLFNEMRVLDADPVQIENFLYELCKEVPAKDFRMPHLSYKLYRRQSDEDTFKVYEILSTLIHNPEYADAELYYNFAVALSSKKITPTDYKKMRFYYEKSLECKDAVAPRIQLAKFYSAGIGGEQDFDKALDILNSPLINSNNPEVLFIKASIFRASNPQKAAQYYLQAHQAGFPAQDAIIEYANCLIIDESGCINKDNNKNLKIAFSIYKKNLEHLSERNKIKYAICCTLVGSCEEKKKGIRILEDLSRKNSPIATYELFLIKIRSVDTAKDARIALNLIQKYSETAPHARIQHIVLSAYFYQLFNVGSFHEFHENMRLIAQEAQQKDDIRGLFTQVAYYAFHSNRTDFFSLYPAIFQQAIHEGDAYALLLQWATSYTKPAQRKNINDNSGADSEEQKAASPTRQEEPESDVPDDESNDVCIDYPKLNFSSDEEEDSAEEEEDDEDANISHPTTAATTTTTCSALDKTDITAFQQQWAKDRQRKSIHRHNVRYKKLDQSLSVAQNLFSKKPCKYTPRFEHLQFFLCLFGKSDRSIHHFTHTNAQQAFAAMNCKTWIKGNSFFIEAEDTAGNIHTFSSHIPHGKSNMLYRPTDKYLQRFCLSIGLTLEVIKAAENKR